jgi:hypothetical protein
MKKKFSVDILFQISDPAEQGWEKPGVDDVLVLVYY